MLFSKPPEPRLTIKQRIQRISIQRVEVQWVMGSWAILKFFSFISLAVCFKPSEKPLYLASISKVDINLYSCLACSFSFIVCITSSILLVNSLFAFPVLRYSKNSFNSLSLVSLKASAFIITFFVPSCKDIALPQVKSNRKKSCSSRKNLT